MNTHEQPNPAANPYGDTVPPATSGQPGSDAPKYLTALMVLVIVIAGLGILSSLAGIATSFLGPGMSQSIIEQAEANPDDRDLQFQADIQRKSQAITNDYLVFGYIIMAATSILCIALLVGAILALRRSPMGRQILLVALLGIVVCDIAKTILTSYQQTAVFNVLGDSLPEQFVSNSDIPEENAKQAGDIMRMSMTAARIGTVVVSVGWLLLKAFLYVFTFFYLKRPKVVDHFLSTGENPVVANPA